MYSAAGPGWPAGYGRIPASRGGQGRDQAARRFHCPGRLAVHLAEDHRRAVAAGGFAAFGKGGEGLLEELEGGLELPDGGLELDRGGGVARLQQGLGGLLGEHPLPAREIDGHRVAGHLLGQPAVDDERAQVEDDEQHDGHDEPAGLAGQGLEAGGHDGSACRGGGEPAYVSDWVGQLSAKHAIF